MSAPASKRLRPDTVGMLQRPRGMSFSRRMRTLSDLVTEGHVDRGSKLRIADAILANNPEVAAAFGELENTGNPSSIRALATRGIAHRADMAGIADMGSLSVHSSSTGGASMKGMHQAGGESVPNSGLSTQRSGMIQANNVMFSGHVPFDQPLAGMDSILAQSLLSSLPPTARAQALDRGSNGLEPVRESLGESLSSGMEGSPGRASSNDSSDEEGIDLDAVQQQQRQSHSMKTAPQSQRQSVPVSQSGTGLTPLLGPRAGSIGGASTGNAGSAAAATFAGQLRALRNSFDAELGIGGSGSGPTPATIGGKRPRGPSNALFTGPGMGMGGGGRGESFDLGGGEMGLGSSFDFPYPLSGSGPAPPRKASMGLMGLNMGMGANLSTVMGSGIGMGLGIGQNSGPRTTSFGFPYPQVVPRFRMPSDLNDDMEMGLGSGPGTGVVFASAAHKHSMERFNRRRSGEGGAGRTPGGAVVGGLSHLDLMGSMGGHAEEDGVGASRGGGGMIGDESDEEGMGLRGHRHNGGSMKGMGVGGRVSHRLNARREAGLVVSARRQLDDDVWAEEEEEQGGGEASPRVQEGGARKSHTGEGQAQWATPNADADEFAVGAGEPVPYRVQSRPAPAPVAKAVKVKKILAAPAPPPVAYGGWTAGHRTGSVAPPNSAPPTSALPESAPAMHGALSMYAAYRGSDVLRSRAGAAQVPYGAGGSYAAAKATAAARRDPAALPMQPVRGSPAAKAQAPSRALAGARRQDEAAGADADYMYGASLGMSVMDDEGEEGREEEEEDIVQPEEEGPTRVRPGGAVRAVGEERAAGRQMQGQVHGHVSAPSVASVSHHPSVLVSSGMRRYTPLPGVGAGPGPRGYDPSHPVFPEVYESTTNTGVELPVVSREPGWVGAYPPDKRLARLARFLHRRQNRVWEKTVKYDVRKSFADSRLRVKGRFVKKEDEALLRDFMQLV